MEPLSTAAVATIAMDLAQEVIEMFPNFDERKKQKFYELRKKYENEKVKPRGRGPKGRSNRTLLNLRDECLRYGETIIKEVRQSKG